MRTFFAKPTGGAPFFTCAAFFIATFGATLASAAAPPAKLEIAISPQRIYQGESARLYVRVDNLEGVENPDVSYLSDRFDFQYLGATNNSSSRVFYEGGVERRVDEKGVVFNYVLTPKTSGTLTIEPPQIAVDGGALEAQSATLEVVPFSTTDLVAVETTISPSSDVVFPLVPFDVVVDVYVKELPEKYRETDPISLISQNVSAPRLAIPWLESPQLADATVPDVALEDWLGELRATTGFAINNFSFSDPLDFGFSFFEERRATTFLPSKERVERPDADGANVGYWKYSFKRRLRAEKSGTLTFAPVSLKGAFLTFDADGNPSTKSVYVASQPTKIDVAPIPEDAAPKNYVGVFGKIRWNVEIAAQSLAVGEATTLTATLRGYGSFDAAKAPELSEIANVRDAFKVYPATERSLDDGVAFDYKIRPTAPGKATIPALEISYFDVEKGEFVAERSEPIEIDVREGLRAADENGVDESDSRPTAKSDSPTPQLGASKRLAAIVAFGIFGGATFFVALFFGVRALVRSNARRVAFGNKRIVDAARRRLESGLMKIDAEPAEGLALVRLAFLRLVRRRFAQPIDSLTDAEVLDFLRREFETKKTPNGPRREDDRQTTAQMREFFQNAERVRFGGATALDADFRAKTRELFRRWVDFLTARTKKLAVFAGSAEREFNESPSYAPREPDRNDFT